MKTTTFVLLVLFLFISGAGLMAQEWRAATNKSPATDGFVAGNEADGSPIYIIRAPFQGGNTVGKFIPKSKAAYVPWGGKENSVTNFEYYAGKGRWVRLRAHDPLPPDAIVGGNEAGGERLFIIRAPQGKALVPGKFSEATGQAYIPWGGKELEVKEFEILVRDQAPPPPVAQGPEWILADTNNPATLATPAGVSDDGTPSFLIRAPFQGGVVPGKYNPKAKAAYVPWGGKENKISSFELYVGRGVWIPADPRLPPPPNAVQVGTESDGNPLLAIRAPLGKALIPGKYSVGGKAAYIPYGGKELVAKTYEFLVREGPTPAEVQAVDSPATYEPPMEDKLSKLLMTARPKDVQARGGLISVTADHGKDGVRLNGAPVDVYRFKLDQDATFGLSISGVADITQYDVFLLNEGGATVTRPVSDGKVRIFYGERPTREPLFLFVVQKGTKPLGRYGFTLQETSYTIEGELEGDFSNQESIIPMMWDTNPPFWTIGGSAGESDFLPLFDARDAQGKVLARSEIVDPNDGVSQLSFSPPYRGAGDLRIYPKTPTEGGHWKLYVQLSSGN